MKRAFSKPPLTFEEQLALLEERGMVITDKAKAEFYLRHLNYYRLGAYWLPFEADHSTHTFRTGTEFDSVLNFYFFDRELRLLVLDAVERIEVSVRTQWAYTLAHKHGTHSYTDRSICQSGDHWAKNLNQLREELNRSDETFIHHFLRTYKEEFPPVWAACEVVSLGLLSRLYRNLKPMGTRSAISHAYGLDEGVLSSWLHHLSIVRNICAHHSRLWNREFTVTSKVPRKPQDVADAFVPASRKIYNTFVVLIHFMDTVSPGHQFRERLTRLINKHGVATKLMGFPDAWCDLKIWQSVNG